MRTFREWLGESKNTNWSRVETKRRVTQGYRDVWKPNKEFNADAGKFGVKPDALKKAVENRMKKQRASTKPVTLPTLPPRRSE